MEDYKPSLSAENEPDDDEDDEESGSKSNSSAKASRAISKMAMGKDAEKKDAVPSIMDRLFQKKEEKPDKKPGKEEPKDDLKPTQESKTEEAVEPGAEETAAEVTAIESEPAETEDSEEEDLVEKSIEPESEPWDEGEITDDGEINLSRTIVRQQAEKESAETIASDEEVEPGNLPEPAVTEEEPVSLFAGTTEPEPAAIGGGDGGGEGPPEGSEDSPEEGDEPEAPRQVRSIFGSTGGGGYQGSPTERFTGVLDARTAENAMNEAIYRATKMGQNRGVVAGLLTGLYIGHRGKKKLATKFEKTINAKDTEVKRLEDNKVAIQEGLGALESTKGQLRAVLAEKPGHRPLTAAEMPGSAAARAETAGIQADEAFMRIESVPGAPLTSRLEALSAAPLVIGAETLRRQFGQRERVRYAVDERGNVDIRRSADQLPDKELPPEDLPITEDLYTTPDGRRIEMSSWHRIEIDQKTGKVVKNPEVEYGEEFRHEIQQEVLKNQRSKDGKGAAMQLGNMASASVSGQGSQPVSQLLPVPASSTVPVAAEPVQSIVKNDNDDETMDPLVWVIVGVFVVILFLFAILR